MFLELDRRPGQLTFGHYTSFWAVQSQIYYICPRAIYLIGTNTMNAF
jgi:hypothetical protein